MEENKKEEKKKFNIKERWKDKRERAKIELMLYGIFFLAIIIFARYQVVLVIVIFLKIMI